MPGQDVTEPYGRLLGDLADEELDLDAVVGTLEAERWRTPTPAEGWDVCDSIAHLALSEELAAAAARDPGAFTARLEELLAAARGGAADLEDVMAGGGRSREPRAVLEWWRTARAATLAALGDHGPRDRLPWFAGPMSAMSFATARLMETWAHGQDVVDALGVHRVPSARLRHVADLGVRTRHHTYKARGRTPPDADVRVDLTAPDGSRWEWGSSRTDLVRGPALDFCLVVTQRRNPADTALQVTGPLAREWIDIAQVFAGPVTDHRPPRG